MAITTDNGKLAMLEIDQDYEPGLPLSPGTLGQDDDQQLLWGFPEILWGVAAALAFVLDLNTRLMVYLRDYYSVTGGDLTYLTNKYLNALTTGDRTQKMRRLIQDATDSMT